MSAPIEDVSSLPGKKVSDQQEIPIGEIKEVYALDGDGQPACVTVEVSEGIGEKRNVFIPLARIKEENGNLRVPYSNQHVGNTPEIDASDGISEGDERKLRDHYGIDTGDQELRSDNKSYAALVPEDEGTAKLADDPDKLETPDPDRRSEETEKRLHDPGSSEMRHADAGDLVNAGTDEEGKDGERHDEGADDDEEQRGDESKDQGEDDG